MGKISTLQAALTIGNEASIFSLSRNGRERNKAKQTTDPDQRPGEIMNVCLYGRAKPNRALPAFDRLFPPAIFPAGTSSSNAGRLQVYRGNSWITYLLADLGVLQRWVRAGDARLADQGGETVALGEGLFGRRRGACFPESHGGLARVMGRPPHRRGTRAGGRAGEDGPDSGNFPSCRRPPDV